MSSSQTPQEPRADHSSKILEAILGSFYPDLVQSGRYAKERAANMLSSVAVLSAALIAVLTASGIRDASLGARVSAVVAVSVWVAASLFFAWSAKPVERAEYPEIGYDKTDELVEFVLAESSRIEKLVERRLARATNAIVVALLATVISFIVYVLGGVGEEWVGVRVSMADDIPTMASCGNSQDVARLYVDPATIRTPMVSFRRICGDEQTLWSVNSGNITALELE